MKDKRASSASGLLISTGVCHHSRMAKFIVRIFMLLHGVTAALFTCAAVSLVLIATRMSWIALTNGLDSAAALEVIEAVGLLAAAVVALQIAQTIAEEEIVRDAHISAPTRVRRFLSRFFVVVLVALAIEGLVSTFKAVHESLELLPYVASLLVGTSILLIAWGAFIWLNRAAEELEPEAMRQAKGEDEKLEQPE